MKNIYLDRLDTMLREGIDNEEELHRICEMLHPAVLGQRLSELEPEAAKAILDRFMPENQALVLSHFRKEKAGELAELYMDEMLADIIEMMPHDDRVDLIKQIPEARREKLLMKVEEPDREDIMRLSLYEEETAGAVMTSEFVTLRETMTVEEALVNIRRVAKDRETIYNAYVVDTYNRLTGIVTLRELLLYSGGTKMADIMNTDVVFAREDEDQEVVANRLSEYDLIAMPVIDDHNKMVGIVTFDDVMDVRKEEATEDFHKMGSVGLMNISLSDAPIKLLILKRLPWLLVLVFMNIFSGAGIAFFEDTIEAVVALVFFLPLLIDSGGNAGAQASTLMVRALATGDVKIRDWFRLFSKEIFVAVIIGIVMGLAVSLIGFFRAGPEVAVVVSITMICCVTVGSLLGMSLPFLLQKFNFDPATASAPLITSLADIAGVIMYFSIATWYLGIGS